MTNLPKLLQRLSEVAPDVCQYKNWRETLDTYHIGDYVFWFVQGDLRAHSEASGSSDFIQGQPACAWLLDSLMQVCEGKGWDIETITINNEKYDDGLQSRATVNRHYVWSKTITEALLEALIAAMGNE